MIKIKTKVNVGKSLVVLHLSNGKTFEHTVEGQLNTDLDNEQAYIEEPVARVDRELSEYSCFWVEVAGHTILVPTDHVIHASVSDPEPFWVDAEMPAGMDYYWDSEKTLKLDPEERAEAVQEEKVTVAEFNAATEPDFPVLSMTPKEKSKKDSILEIVCIICLGAVACFAIYNFVAKH